MQSKRGWSVGNDSTSDLLEGFWSFQPNNSWPRSNRHRRDRNVNAARSGRAHEVGIDRDPGDPRQPFVREHERPTVALLARHVRVDEDVLHLPGAAAAQGAHAQTRSPKTDVQPQSGAKMRHLAVATRLPLAAPHLEPGCFACGAP